MVGRKRVDSTASAEPVNKQRRYYIKDILFDPSKSVFPKRGIMTGIQKKK